VGLTVRGRLVPFLEGRGRLEPFLVPFLPGFLDPFLVEGLRVRRTGRRNNPSRILPRREGRLVGRRDALFPVPRGRLEPRTCLVFLEETVVAFFD